MSQTHQAQTITPTGKSHSAGSAGFLLNWFGLAALLGVLLLAAWNGQVVIVILLGLALSAAGLAKLWSRLSLVGVGCQRFLNERRVFPGEKIELRVRLTNRKLLPLPWVQVDNEIAEQLVPAEAPSLPESKPGFRLLSHAGAVLWYTGISWRSHLHCRKRGYYKMGPTKVLSGDIFGLYPRSATQQNTDEVIVYPKLFPIAQLGLPSLYPLGETKAERRIFEDQTRTIGVRDYSPHDSLRHIHWKASARHQHLQVKVFEPTTTLKVALFLAVDSFQGDGVSEDDFELGISTAASVANYIVQQRSQVGLFVNSRLPDTGQPIRIPPGGGMNQLVNILEALAKVTLVPSGSFEGFFQEKRGSLPWGTTLILIIAKPSEALQELLASLKEVGHKLMVLQIGEPEKDLTDNSAGWYNVSTSGDLTEFAPKGVG
jgi:uncharacterized protein (DUF58 family)